MTPRIIALAAAVALPGTAVAIPLSEATSFFVFGDSLSDPGNLPTVGLPFLPGNPATVPFYADERFTDGPVWAEIAALEVGGDALNVAFGGARADARGAVTPIPDLDGQIDLYEAFLGEIGGTGPLGSDPLAAIWFGANDIFQTFGTASLPGAIVAAAEAIGDGIDRLSGLGIANVVVFNLPDLSRTPLFVGTPAAGLARLATTTYNDLLAAQVADAPGDVTLFDVNALFDDLLGDPAAFGARYPAAAGITVVDEACLGDGPDVFLCDAPETYVFFDDVHPTQQVHAALAAALGERLAPIPLPAGAPLLLLGVGALALARRRAA